jgi:glycerophosphoryl diester phosphodiesterase
MSALDRMPAVFAHRGGWGTATQNTLENLTAAAEAGAHLEYDVHRTLDGVLVVHHNARIGSRTILEREFGGIAIRNTRYADLPLLPGGERIPTVREVMEMAKRTGRAQLVETKHVGDEAPLLALAKQLGVGPDQLYLQSFHATSIRNAKAIAPEYAAGVLGHTVRFSHRNPGMSSIRHARRVGADFVLPRYNMLSSAYVDAARAADLAIVPWTPWAISDAANAPQLLADPHVAAIIANERGAAVSAARTVRGPGSVAAR